MEEGVLNWAFGYRHVDSNVKRQLAEGCFLQRKLPWLCRFEGGYWGSGMEDPEGEQEILHLGERIWSLLGDDRSH